MQLTIHLHLVPRVRTSGVKLLLLLRLHGVEGKNFTYFTFILFTSIFVLNKIYINENCGLLGYYAGGGANCLRAFWNNLSVPSSRVRNLLLTLEDGTDRLPQNVGKQLPLFAT